MSSTDASSHFARDGAGVPTAPGRFVKISSIEPIELVEGLEFRPVLGEGTLTNFVSFQPHTTAPRHAHEEEQIVIVLEGEFEFEIDGQSRTLRAGDVAVVPPWVPHGAFTRDTSCLEVDVFNPPRHTLVDYALAQRRHADEVPLRGTDAASSSDEFG